MEENYVLVLLNEKGRKIAKDKKCNFIEDKDGWCKCKLQDLEKTFGKVLIGKFSSITAIIIL